MVRLLDQVNFVPNDGYGPALQRAKVTLVATEFAGDIGDVLFTHPLLMHSGGINASHADRPGVRLAVVCDFQKVRGATRHPRAALAANAARPGRCGRAAC